MPKKQTIIKINSQNTSPKLASLAALLEKNRLTQASLKSNQVNM